jgi:hypothetical protein
MASHKESPVLAEYRAQARQLADALAKVNAIHEETASLTMTRDAALSRRQELLNSWVESENEASVEELSKLRARAEVFEAKLKAQAGKLAQAEAILKQALETFGTSFRNLHGALQKFLFDRALDRILAQVHPPTLETCREPARVRGRLRTGDLHPARASRRISLELTCGQSLEGTRNVFQRCALAV